MPPALICLAFRVRWFRRFRPIQSAPRTALATVAAGDQAQTQRITAVPARLAPDDLGERLAPRLSREGVEADLEERTCGFGLIDDHAQAGLGLVPRQTDESPLLTGIAWVMAVFEAAHHEIAFLASQQLAAAGYFA